MENLLPIPLYMTTEQNQSIGDVVKNEQKRLLDFIRKRVPSEEDAEDIL